MNMKCIYCGFEVPTGLRCCGVSYNLNGTYSIPTPKPPKLPKTDIKKLIHAYTENKIEYPAFINVHESSDEKSMIFTIRNEGNGGRNFASVTIPKDKVKLLVSDLQKYLEK